MTTLVTRRGFFGAVSGLAAAPLAAQTAPAATADLAWLDALKGKHKQVFDLGSTELTEDPPIRLANNYLNTMRDAMHAAPGDVIAAIGIARSAFPINASDALWEKYRLGELWKINGPDGKPATKNIFLGSADHAGPTVRSLMARGVTFWQCNIALGGVARQFADETKAPVDKIRAELAAGLVPGVKIVPAHSLAVGLVQERGFTYMRP